MTYRLLQLIGLTLLLTACPQKEEKKAPQEPQPVKQEVQLKEASFNDLQGYQKDDMTDAYHTFELNCQALKNQKNKVIGSGLIQIPTAEIRRLCAEFTKVKPENFKQFVETNFKPYLVTHNNDSNGKFTSYYEAELNASRHKSDRYKYPIYGRPEDLIEFNPQDFDKSLPSKRLVGRVHKQKLVPYYTRAEIMHDGYQAPVILWSDSYIDIYVMQIQGSAIAKLDDGSEVRIAYADTNGREFKGIGSILLEKGLIKPGQASMGSIKRWLKENPGIADDELNENLRYVFHRLSDAEGPIGALGVPLTAGRSLAVDRSFIPLGSLLWLETAGPHREKIQKLVIAQDIGGAIKGAVRGDYFWGSGGDEVLEMAGKMNSAGRYFILLPSNMEIKTNEQ